MAGISGKGAEGYGGCPPEHAELLLREEGRGAPRLDRLSSGSLGSAEHLRWPVAERWSLAGRHSVQQSHQWRRSAGISGRHQRSLLMPQRTVFMVGVSTPPAGEQAGQWQGALSAWEHQWLHAGSSCRRPAEEGSHCARTALEAQRPGKSVVCYKKPCWGLASRWCCTYAARCNARCTARLAAGGPPRSPLAFHAELD